MDLYRSSVEKMYTEEQQYFLVRLNRLVSLRNQQTEKLNESGIRFLDHSIYSTYTDCIDMGVAEEAKYLLDRIKTRQLTPTQEYKLLPPPSA